MSIKEMLDEFLDQEKKRLSYDEDLGMIKFIAEGITGACKLYTELQSGNPKYLIVLNYYKHNNLNIFREFTSSCAGFYGSDIDNNSVIRIFLLAQANVIQNVKSDDVNIEDLHSF